MAWNSYNPQIVMVIVQIAFSAVAVFYQLAIRDGMSLSILVAYRNLFGTVSATLLAFLLERNNRPKLTWMIIFHAFLSALFGSALSQNLYLASLALTSASFTSAMMNLLPAVTFIMAVSLQLERLAARTIEGKAKLIGTILGIGGAMVLTFYKGVEINLWSTHVDLLHHGGLSAPSGNRVLGLLLALGSCVTYSVWLMIQTRMNEIYPCPFSSSALVCAMGTIQAAIFALCTERDWKEWQLGWNIRLFTVAYSGGLAYGPIIPLIAWGIRKRGPLFASVFNPLTLVIVAVAGSLLLEEKLHLGSVIGGVLIVCGLYAVLWGKGRELRKMALLERISAMNPSEQVLHNPNSAVAPVEVV